MLLLDRKYSKFLGTRKLNRRSSISSSCSSSESDGKYKSEAAHIVGNIATDSKFDTDFTSDKVEVKEGKDFIKITLR